MKDSDIACDPVNLRRIGKDEDFKRPKYQIYGASRCKFPMQYGGRPRNTLFTKSKEDDPSNHETTKDETQAVKFCVLCKGAHELKFMSRILQERYKGKKRIHQV